MDLLTTTVNVPAERAKLRALRDEIAADVAHKEAIRREYSHRGFPWLPDLHPLAPEGQPSNGGAPAGSLRSGADLEVSPAAALMHEAQAGDCGCRCGSGGVGREWITELPTNDGQKNETPLREQRGI